MDAAKDVEEHSVGALAGLEYRFSAKIGLIARFIHDYNHIGIKRDAVLKEFKLESVQLSINITLFK